MPRKMYRHDQYGQREKRRLRRLARREVETITTTAPAGRGGAKPFVVEMDTESAFSSAPQETCAVMFMRRACAQDMDVEAPPVTLLVRVSPAQAGDMVRRGLAGAMGLHRVDANAAGLAYRDRIKILIDRDPEPVARITAHEMRHTAQSARVFRDRDKAEADAESYAEDAMLRLWPAVQKKLRERVPANPPML